MPRLRQVRRADATPEIRRMYDLLFGDRDPVDEPGTETGTPGNWWTVFAIVPDVFAHAIAGFQLYRSSRRKLDPKLRELGQIRAGWARGSQFVFSQHCKAARFQVGNLSSFGEDARGELYLVSLNGTVFRLAG